MRQLILKPHAEESVYSVAEWLASQYFPDTGLKFIDDVEAFLLRYCNLSNLKFPLCKNKRLAKRKLCCVIYKRKWVVAFKYTQNKLTVHEFIWGKKLR